MDLFFISCIIEPLVLEEDQKVKFKFEKCCVENNFLKFQLLELFQSFQNSFFFWKFQTSYKPGIIQTDVINYFD